MTDAARLRAQADRLSAEAAEAERAARAVEEAFLALSPVRQAADLLHRHFTRTYPGAGGAMDGGDPWYYEGWGGHEHNCFEKMAVTLADRWQCPMEAVVARLSAMAEVLKGYDSQAVRSRQARSAGYQETRDRKAAHDALDNAIDAGVASYTLRNA